MVGLGTKNYDFYEKNKSLLVQFKLFNLKILLL